jgi:hypothetical protein
MFTKMPYKDPAMQKHYRTVYYEKNKERAKNKQKNYHEDLKNHAIESLLSGEVADRRKWELWCKQIQRKAPKNPYSASFTSDVMFEMMIKGCFYCGDTATSIDRLDSDINHVPDNCVGCCHGCNMSKGAADPMTFIRKAYYRVYGKYADDSENIWFVYKTKPDITAYKRSADAKGVSFDLTSKEFDKIIKGDCAYCKRSPTSWFGIDRKIPSEGYVLGNVASCCYDCNVDKFEDAVDTMIKRNERIANRVVIGKLIMTDGPKIILNKGVMKSSKKVCVHGNIYTSQKEASRALGKGAVYIRECIKYKRCSDVIFEISADFYDFAITNKLENITKKMYMLFERM